MRLSQIIEVGDILLLEPIDNTSICIAVMTNHIKIIKDGGLLAQTLPSMMKLCFYMIVMMETQVKTNPELN